MCNIATKDGKKFFIKKMLYPKYPVSSKFSDDYISEKIEECDAWLRYRKKIISSLPGDGQGNLVKPIEYFRDGATYYEVAYCIISSAMKEADNVGRLMNVYKYFVDNFEYEEVDAENKKFHYPASPFLYKRAVCDGFSLAFSYVINRVGIECGVVSGYGTKESYNSEHMWNIVRLNGKYYHLDVTWDISTKSTGSRFLDYFLIDDALAMRDHIWNHDIKRKEKCDN